MLNTVTPIQRTPFWYFVTFTEGTLYRLCVRFTPGSAVLYSSENAMRPNYTSFCSQARDFTTLRLYRLC